MRRHRRLPHALPRADDGDRREVERLEGRRFETKVCSDIREPLGESSRCPAQPLGRSEDRLVGEIDHDLRSGEIVDEWDAVIQIAAQLLGAAHEDGADPFVREGAQRIAHHRRIVLPVDERDRFHRRAVTSRSIRPVYFSYSPVTRSNWMICSCP